jgi:hypothetical protein
MKRMRHLAIVLAVAAATVSAFSAGCSGKGSARRGAGASGANAAGTSGQGASGGHGIKFLVNLEFSGVQPVHGSFVDPDHAGDGTCTQWANLNPPIVGWLGPQTVAGTTTTVDGKPISYLLQVGHERFHGPGTYSGGVVSALQIAGDTFMGKDSSVTLNPDGSGSATFTVSKMGYRDRTESGTIHWTCGPA